ncbi:MAG: hypothetical protein JWR15_1754 [Prosthecobacter sp.]|nr:hypothetical protein [Prosthecobacter sp.]
MRESIAEERRQLRAERLEGTLEEATWSMSNSKWRRLIQVVANTGVTLPVSEWCFLRDTGRRWSQKMPLPDDVLPDGSGIDEVNVFGPFRFRDVFFLRWPRRFNVDQKGRSSLECTQDIDVIHGALHASGQFDLVLDQSGLTLWAYRFPGQAISSDAGIVYDAEATYCPNLGL